MRITEVHCSGLGIGDLAISLPKVATIVGENEVGKSTILGAIQIGAVGFLTGAAGVQITKKPKGVMLLAAPGAPLTITLRGLTNDHEDVEDWWLRRTFRRGRDGKVIQTIEQSFGPAVGVREAENLIASRLKTREEVFDPTRLLRMSAAEMRKEIMASVAPRMSLEAIVPRDMPSWGKAEKGDDPHVWMARASKAASERVAEAAALVRVAEAAVAETEAGWSDEEPEGPIVEKIERLKEILGRGAKLATLVEQMEQKRDLIARIEGELDAQRATAQDGISALESARDVRAQLARAAHRRGILSSRARLKETVDSMETSVAALSASIALLEASGRRKDAAAERAGGAERALIEAEKLVSQGKFLVDRLAEDREALFALAPPKACFSCGATDPAEKAAYDTEHRTLSERIAEWEAKIAAREQPPDLAALRADLVQAREDLRRSIESEEALLRERTALGRDQGRLATAKAEYDGGTAWLAEHGEHGPALAAVEREAQALDERVAAGGRAEERARVLAKELSRAKVGLRTIEAEIDDLEDVPSEAEEALTRASLQATEERLAQVREANALRRRHREAEEKLDEAMAAHEKAKTWKGRVTEVEIRVVDETVVPLRESMSELAGGDVDLRLVDESGGPDCSFLVGGVPLEVLSAGRRVRFLAAFVGALLAHDPSVRWKPLILDSIDSVSLRYRPKLIEDARALVERGVFNQAILLGCPDSDEGLPEDTIRLAG